MAELKLDKKLIALAKLSRCKLCQEEITETEADTGQFQATQTHRGGYCFVHTRCWKKEVSNENIN